MVVLMQIMDTGQWKVSRTNIAGIWVAFFSRCQRYSCGQGAIGSDPRGNPSPEVDLYTDYLERCAPHATGVRAKVRFESPHTFLSAALMHGCDRWRQIYNIDSGVEQWIDYPRVIKMLEDVGFDGIISLVFELNTVFGQKEAAGVEHLTEEECVPLAVSHLRDCIAGTAPSPPPLGDGPIEWAEPVTEHHLATGFSRL